MSRIMVKDEWKLKSIALKYYCPAYGYRTFVSAETFINDIEKSNDIITLYTNYIICRDEAVSNLCDDDNCDVITIEVLGNGRYSIKGRLNTCPIIIENKDLVNRIIVDTKRNSLFRTIKKSIKYLRFQKSNLRSDIKNTRKEYNSDIGYHIGIYFQEWKLFKKD